MQRKKNAFLIIKSTKTIEAYQEYQILRPETYQVVRKPKAHYWKIFTKELEMYFYGQQKEISRLLREQRA